MTEATDRGAAKRERLAAALRANLKRRKTGGGDEATAPAPPAPDRPR